MPRSNFLEGGPVLFFLAFVGPVAKRAALAFPFSNFYFRFSPFAFRPSVLFTSSCPFASLYSPAHSFPARCNYPARRPYVPACRPQNEFLRRKIPNEITHPHRSAASSRSR